VVLRTRRPFVFRRENCFAFLHHALTERGREGGLTTAFAPLVPGSRNPYLAPRRGAPLLHVDPIVWFKLLGPPA
jgi:hypothetical protein